jgi:hypothetical protein
MRIIDDRWLVAIIFALIAVIAAEIVFLTKGDDAGSFSGKDIEVTLPESA